MSCSHSINYATTDTTQTHLIPSTCTEHYLMEFCTTHHLSLSYPAIQRYSKEKRNLFLPKFSCTPFPVFTPNINVNPFTQIPDTLFVSSNSKQYHFILLSWYNSTQSNYTCGLTLNHIHSNYFLNILYNLMALDT